MCWTKNRIYVFEFKVDGSGEDALRQIDEKGYLIPYKYEEAESHEAEPVTKAVAEPVDATGLATGKNTSASSATERSPATERRLVKVGVNISTQTRTIESWKIATE